MCQSISDVIFKVEGVAKVIKQPETPEEEKLCEQAIESCPVRAISNEAPTIKMDTTPMKMAA
jgi:ferredoxin